MDYETPHPTSSLGHLLPWGEGRENLSFPLPWGEGVPMHRRGRGVTLDELLLTANSRQKL